MFSIPEKVGGIGMSTENRQQRSLFHSVGRHLFFVLLAAITGCSTVPKTASLFQPVDRLPEDQTVYMKIDVHSNIEMLSSILNIGGIEEDVLQAALERTSDVLFSLLLKENGNREFSFIASGEYPAGIVKRKLKKNDDWVKQGDRIPYWVNPALPLRLAVPDRRHILGTNGSIDPLLAEWEFPSAMDIPRELRHELEISDLVFFMPSPGKSVLDNMAGGRTYPIELIWITLFDPGVFELKRDSYKLDAVFLMETEDDAAKFSKIARLLTAAIMRKENIGDIADLKSSVEVYYDGTIVRIQGIPVSLEDLITFLAGKLSPSE